MKYKYIHFSFLLLFTLLAFSSLYVKATMNAIHDTYVVGLTDFKEPFYVIYLVILSFSIIGLYYSSVKSNLFKKYLSHYGLSLLIISVIVWLLNFFPCYHTYQTNEILDLFTVIKYSLLCPHYSNRSFPPIFLFLILGIFMYRTKNKKT